MSDEVVINAEQGGDTQAHIDAMVAKAAGTAIETPDPVGDDPNAGVKATADETPKTPEGETEGQPQVEDDGDAAAVIEAAGLNVEEVLNTLQTDGSLSAEQYEALAKIGVTKAVVDTYIAGQMAVSEAFISNMHNAVGGEENLNNILTWAGENMDPAEIEQFNATIDTGSETAVRMALKGLQMRYNEEGMNAPTLVGGQRVETSLSAFRSTAELTQAMRDPRYASDPAYRADVEAKLFRSSIF